LRDKTLGPRLVPIVADEARTFGMANLFRQSGIYSPQGQLYTPEDNGSMLAYREARDGNFRRGNYRGRRCLIVGARPDLTVSMAGRCFLFISTTPCSAFSESDLIWAAADQSFAWILMERPPANDTPGRGPAAQDGSSHLVAATIPNCRAYDPTFSGELAVIWLTRRQMMEKNERNVFYYITVMNENYEHPSLVDGVADSIIKGMFDSCDG